MNNMNESYCVVSLSGLKEVEATQLKVPFCLLPWETFSRKWLLNQHREHPYCATLDALLELYYRIENVQSHRSAALKC